MPLVTTGGDNDVRFWHKADIAVRRLDLFRSVGLTRYDASSKLGGSE
jgi:hypothetical protein